MEGVPDQVTNPWIGRGSHFLVHLHPCSKDSKCRTSFWLRLALSWCLLFIASSSARSKTFSHYPLAQSLFHLSATSKTFHLQEYQNSSTGLLSRTNMDLLALLPYWAKQWLSFTTRQPLLSSWKSLHWRPLADQFSSLGLKCVDMVDSCLQCNITIYIANTASSFTSKWGLRFLHRDSMMSKT